MADASFTYNAQGAEKVVQSNQRVEQSMNKMGRGGKNAGMAILEASRGLEDFAMAGMRGVMNNIPGVMMSLGVGMGLTGVMSVATIAVWKGAEALEAYMNKLHDIKMARFSKGILMASIDATQLANLEKATDLAKQAAEAMKQVEGTRMEMESSFHTMEEGVSALQRELEYRKEILELTKQNAFNEDIRAAATRKSLADEKAALDLAESKRAEQIKSIELLETQIQSLEKAGDVSAIKEEERAFTIKSRNLFKEKRRQLGFEQETISETDANGNVYQWNTGKPKYTEDQIYELASQYVEQVMGVRYKEFEKKTQDAQLSEKTANELKLQLEAEKGKLASQEKSYEAAQKTYEINKKLLDIAEQQTVEEEARAALKEWNEYRKKQNAIEQMAMQERIDTSNLLSTQGRSGLAGNEIRAAMETLNFAKKSYQALREIVNNTRKFRPTYQPG